MKNFLEHLTESQKTYDFRIKIADIDPTESMDRLEAALDTYGLSTISKPKRLPIKDTDIDFPGMGPIQIYLIDVVLTYPVNDQQLRAIIAERWCKPQANIVVVNPNHPEEQRRWDLPGNDVKEYVKGEAVLDKPYKDDPEATAAGKVYAEAGSLLKELAKVKFEIAGSEKADGKTSNELPQGTQSPVGSTQNKLPKAGK